MKKLEELKAELIAGKGCITYLMGCAFRGAILADAEICELEELLETCPAGHTAIAMDYGKAVKYKAFFKEELCKLTKCL